MSQLGKTDQTSAWGFHPPHVNRLRSGWRSVRRVLAWSCSLLLAIGVLVVGATIAVMSEGTKLDAESKAFAQAYVNAVVPTWNEDESRSRVSPELDAVTPPAQMDEIFGEMREKLGPGTTADECRGQSNMTISLDKGAEISAVYHCPLHTILGTVDGELSMKDYSGTWKLVGFHVNVPSGQQ